MGGLQAPLAANPTLSATHIAGEGACLFGGVNAGISDMRRAIFAALLLAGAAVSPAAAQWGAGIEIGPGYYDPYDGPPPGYYDDDPYFEDGPYYRERPVFIVPEPRPIVRARPLSPDAVLDILEDEGFRELGPMALRGSFYKLSAVNPEGEVVGLEISAFSGEIEREFILQPARRVERERPARIVAQPAAPIIAPAPRAIAPAPAPSQAAAPPPMRDRLRPVPQEPAEGKDPLVIY